MLVMSTLEHISQHTYIYLYCFVISILFTFVLNYVLFKTIVSGLINFQLSIIFNFAIIMYGCYYNFVPIRLTIHFILYQLIVTAGTYGIYKKIINDRDIIFRRLSKAPIYKMSISIIVFNMSLMAMYYVFVPSTGGGSRIEFMTNRWYSFVRPADFILQPLGYFLAIYLFDHGKRLLPSILLLSLVMPNIASGSKASFVLSILSSFLIYKQLKGSSILIPLKLKLALLAIIVGAIKFSLDRLSVNLLDLSLRFIRTAEATIIVYFSDNPSEACADTSLFAAIHRGVAKLFGDPSALNIDTLFGFSLSIVDYGAHNFTGPNSQVASYVLCNFPGWYNIVAILAISIFFIVMWKFFKIVILKNKFIFTIFLLPFVLNTLDAYAQSYDIGATSLTIILMVLIIISFIRLVYVASRPRIIDNNISC